MLIHNHSHRQQLAYDDAVEYAAELDAAESAHFAQLPGQIKKENDAIVRSLNEGRIFLANEIGEKSFIVHLASCRAVRHQIDRDLAHEAEFDREGKIEGSWHGPGYDDVAKWPNLMTIEEIELMPAYRACKTCNPETAHRMKKRERPVKPTALRSIGASIRYRPRRVPGHSEELYGRRYPGHP